MRFFLAHTCNVRTKKVSLYFLFGYFFLKEICSLKIYSLEAKIHQRSESIECASFCARLATCIFGHLGLNSEPLVVSKFHIGLHDLKEQENEV